MSAAFEPFAYRYMIDAIWVAALVGGVCGFLSCYLMLKGWSLIGDALSHSVVPGVAGAYILGLPYRIGAFETLLRRHYDRVHRLAWRMTGSAHDAEDIAQEVCCTLVERIGELWDGPLTVATQPGEHPPEAPTLPCSGITGVTPRASIASSSSTSTGRTPDAPRPRLNSFSAMMSRTGVVSIGSPTPQQCDRIRLRCNVAVSAGAPDRVGIPAPAGRVGA